VVEEHSRRFRRRCLYRFSIYGDFVAAAGAGAEGCDGAVNANASGSDPAFYLPA